jgi:putative ATP-binding cassette transporter
MLFELFKKSYRIYRPYFGLKGNGLYHTFLSLLIFSGNVSLAFFMSLINATFDTLMASIVPGVSYRAFFSSTTYFSFAVIAYAAVASLNNLLATRLSTSIAHDYNQNMVKRWLNSNAYFGSKFMRPDIAKNENKHMSPAQIISHDSTEVTNNLSYLADNFLMTTSNFIIGLMGLIVLSGPLVFPFMGWSIYIPDYLAISTVIYALGFNLVSGWAGDRLRYQQASEKNAEDNLYHHLHHIKTHAESVAFLNGIKIELPNLMQTMKQHRLADLMLGNIKSMLAFLNSLHQQMASIFGVIISAPNVIEGHMDTTGVFQVAHHFGDVVRWFTWRNENLDKISATLVGLERLEAFENVLNEWEKLQSNPNNNQIQLTPVSHPKPLLFNKVSVNTPQGEKMLGPITLNFPKGSITLIQGPSGIGKTTIFRAIAGLWPFGQGEIHLPKNKAGIEAKISFIPQKPYFPYQKTLLDAIIYPNDITKAPLNKSEITKIKSWMKQLGFKTETIQQLHTVQEWEKTLSGGEQQRIAIISALYKKPDFLFMDEGTSAIDNKNKKIAEQLFKKLLPNTTIAYIDHNPSPDFHNHIINLGEHKPAVTHIAAPTHSAQSEKVIMTRSKTKAHA